MNHAGNPNIDYVMLAQSLGVPGARIDTREQTAAVIRQMLDHDGPFLVELNLSAESEVPRPAASAQPAPVTGNCPCS